MDHSYAQWATAGKFIVVMIVKSNSSEIFRLKREENPVKANAEEYSKNGALIKVLRKIQAEASTKTTKGGSMAAPTKKAGLSFSMSGPSKSTAIKEPQERIIEEDLCPLHKKKLDIVDLTSCERICAKCALFGEHKTHVFREEAEVH